MLNHTAKVIPIELITTLYDEENRIKKEYNAKGQIEIDRIADEKWALLFDGYTGTGRRFRLIGHYDVEFNIFIWS